ncbi:hypothetical protein F2Q69_00016890 [Brassica cretica]|uniref:Uncharacterized protein n=1 Tax=Brassica cretica TaxID=69181 RepID=A0A8S9RA00_BRACR|nr:hypothetical protein F2Q69_00016890 [Brassica cretica]
MQRSKSTTSALVFSVRDDRSGCRYTGRLLRVLRPTVYRNPPKTMIETHQRRCLLRVLSASDGVSSVISRRLKPITADDRSGCLSSQRLLRLLSSSPQEERSNPTTEDDSVGKSRRKRRSSLVISVRRAIETHPPPTTTLSILIFGNIDNCGRQGTSFCIGSVSTRHNGDNLIFRQGEDVQQVMQPSKLRNHNSNLKLSVRFLPNWSTTVPEIVEEIKGFFNTGNKAIHVILIQDKKGLKTVAGYNPIAMRRSKFRTFSLGFFVRDDRSWCRSTRRLLRVLRPTVYRNPPKRTIKTHQRRRLLCVLSASDGVFSVLSRRLKPITDDDRSGCRSSQSLLRLL